MKYTARPATDAEEEVDTALDAARLYIDALSHGFHASKEAAAKEATEEAATAADREAGARTADPMATHAKRRDRSRRRLELEQQLGLPSDHASEALPAEGLEAGTRSELRPVEELPPMPPRHRQTEKKTSTSSVESDGLDA